MIIRRYSAIIGLLIVIISIGMNKFLSSQKQAPEKKSKQAAARPVKVIDYKPQALQIEVNTSGRLIAKNKIEVLAEVGGEMQTGKYPFKEGNTFQKSDVLFTIDASEYRLNLLAQKSNFKNLLIQTLADVKYDYPTAYESWKAYTDALDINKNLAALPKTDSTSLQNFLTARNIFSTYYTLKSQEQRLGKYQIRAPFDGVVSETLIKEGTIIRPNQVLGTYLNPYVFEVALPVNINEARYVKLGNMVHFTSSELAGDWQGRIIRISNTLEPTTQTVTVYAEIKNKDLKEGMYMKASIQGEKVPDVLTLSRKLLIDKNHIYVIKGDTLQLVSVEIKKWDTEQVVIGKVPEGVQIVNQVLPGAFEGMKVKAI